MLQSVARQQRAHLRRLLSPALAAGSASSASSSSLAAALPARAAFAAARPFSGAAGAPAIKLKGGKKADAAAAAAAAAAADDSKGSLEEEYNALPTIPKPSPAELDALCLTEEQLRFAKRPMPDIAERRNLIPGVYVAEGVSVAEHTAADEGKYYEVPEAIQRAIPPVLHRTMAQEFMGGGGYQMVRTPGLQVVAGLKQIYEQKPMPRRVFGIRGASGTGKSATLHYAAQYVREWNEAHPDKPWLLIATRGEEFASEKRGFIAPSATRPGIFDQALYTMDFFAAMAKSEAAALEKITIKRKDKLADLSWEALGEGTPAGTTLLDLVRLAAADREQAPRILYEFVAELRLPTEVPVLVAIDNLNIWDQVSEFVEPHTYLPLQPRRLALVDAFSYFQNHPPKYGASLWALTTRHATLKQAFNHFSFRTVQGVDTYHYSSRELKHCVVHYSVSDFILSEINQELVVRIAGLTGRVPRDVFQQAFFR